MRHSPRFSSTEFVHATVLGTDYRTQDISEKGVKLELGDGHPFRVGGEYVFYLFIAPRPIEGAMESFISALIPFGAAAVAVVLLLGLVNMMRGGSPNRSQTLMRWRVLLQFAVVLLAMGIIWLRAQ